jgi:DNA-binding PadR family transcriptional regulator
MLPFDRLKKSNTIDNLWLYILSLAKKGPIYAYKAKKDIEKNFGFKTGMVSAYRVLYRLEVNGFVKSEKVDRKRIYKITKKGEEELKKAKEFYRRLIKI